MAVSAACRPPSSSSASLSPLVIYGIIEAIDEQGVTLFALLLLRFPLFSILNATLN